MKLSEIFTKMASNETLANVDIEEFDSRTDESDNTDAEISKPKEKEKTDETEVLKDIQKKNSELSAKIKELEAANQKLMSGISLEEDEKTVEERIYDLCVPGHKKEVYKK